MAKLELTTIRAKFGDALLLRHGETTVLIDGGPPGVFRRTLKPHLQALAKNDGSPPKIDLVMVSHIDSDHIAGILDLTDELIDADAEDGRPLLTIQEAWHNSFADMLATSSGLPVVEVREQSLELADTANSDALIAQFMPDAEPVLSSVGQGRRLRHDLARLAVRVNDGFDDGVVLSDSREEPWERAGLTLSVVGPGRSELTALRKEWKKQLPKILAKEKDKEAAAAAARSLDTSVFNLSSLVVLAEAGNSRILLTGDARGDMILDWLPKTKAGAKEHFDVLKLPHHGSDRNVTPDFFARVTADQYIVSGDGRHGNPEPETFEMLFTARPELNYRIHMTYGPDELAEDSYFDAIGFRKMLNRDPRRRQCLRFPGADETSLTVTV